MLADSLSRRGQILPTEWSLSPRVFLQICAALGTPDVDLFATNQNHKLPYPDPAALDSDALSIPWKGIWGYVYPPTSILPQILNKVRLEDCRIMLIAPALPKASWYNQLLELVVETPRSLPTIRTLLRQPRSRIFHSRWLFTCGYYPTSHANSRIFGEVCS